jgi:hypothetical protein
MLSSARENSSFDLTPKADSDGFNNKSLQQAEVKSQEVINGLYMQMGEKHIIETFKSANFGTVLHEYGHYFRRTLSPDEHIAAKKAFGVKDAWETVREALGL